MVDSFKRVQEWHNGLAGDENGRPFVDVIDDHIMLYSQVCTDAKDNEPYTQAHRMLRSLSWDVVQQLNQLKNFLIEVAEYEADEAKNAT